MQSLTFETKVPTDHQVQLPDDLPVGVLVRITVERLTDDAMAEDYQPRTEIGRLALAARKAYLASGANCEVPMRSAKRSAAAVVVCLMSKRRTAIDANLLIAAWSARAQLFATALAIPEEVLPQWTRSISPWQLPRVPTSSSPRRSRASPCFGSKRSRLD